MGTVQYTRLPMEDVDVRYDESLLSSGTFLNDSRNTNTFDYSSAFTYSHASPRKYKSAFTYSGQALPTIESYDIKFQKVKQSFAFRLCHWIVMLMCFVLVIITLPFSALFCVKIIPSHERVVVFRLGRLVATRGPGLVFILPCIDRLHKVDLRPKAFNVPPKQLITQDGAIIEVGAEVFFKVSSIIKSITNVQDLNRSVRILVETILVSRLLKKPLAEIETETARMVNQIQEECNKTCSGWGTQITNIELSQIKVFKKPNPTTSPGFSFPPGTIPSNIAGALPQMLQQLSTLLIPSQDKKLSTQMEPKSTSKACGSVDKATLESAYSALTPQQLLIAVQSIIDEDLVRVCDCVYQFNISGEDGGTFYLDLQHGSGSAGEGRPPQFEADVVFDLNVEDMRRLFCGTLEPLRAYMNGSLQISGDVSTAKKLNEVLKKLNNTT